MGLFISASGIIAGFRRNDVTANNIANVDTPGFQSSRALSEDVATGGTSVAPTTYGSISGSIDPTGNPLDLSTATGFFQVTLPNGTTAYTRDGHFGINAQREVVTSDGARLNPPLTVASNATGVTVLRDGTVSATVPGQLAPQNIGQIEVFQFPNPNGLSSLGGNFYAATAASGTPTPSNGQIPILSGALTGSNVDLVTESVNSAINVQSIRANLNAFHAQDEILGALLNIMS